MQYCKYIHSLAEPWDNEEASANTSHDDRNAVSPQLNDIIRAQTSPHTNDSRSEDGCGTKHKSWFQNVVKATSCSMVKPVVGCHPKHDRNRDSRDRIRAGRKQCRTSCISKSERDTSKAGGNTNARQNVWRPCRLDRFLFVTRCGNRCAACSTGSGSGRTVPPEWFAHTSTGTSTCTPRTWATTWSNSMR